MALPIVSVAQMREWEKATWASGQTEAAVIEKAGRAVGRKAEGLTKPGDLILVLAGKGHNGDDARVAAETIADREVHLVRVIDPISASAQITPLLSRKPGLIIDGLFGIGLNRSLGLDWMRLIQQINESRRPILAVDVPSGLNADTGEPLDESIRATHTLTLGAAKQGLLTPTALQFVGRLEVASQIGLIPYPFTTEVSMIVPEDFLDFPPRRPVGGHKGTFGHVAIIAGSFGFHGAAVLAARGAQRAQPGLITVFTEDKVYHPVAEQLQSAMVQTFGANLELPQTCTAVMIGPGLASKDLSPVVPETARRIWQQSPLTVIVDASGLQWLPPGPCPPNALRVITPHPGEAGRMLESPSAEIQSNRAKSVRELS